MVVCLAALAAMAAEGPPVSNSLTPSPVAMQVSEVAAGTHHPPHIKAAEALRLAGRYIGLAKPHRIRHEVTFVRLDKVTTPRLRLLVNGHRCWEVSFHGVEVFGYRNINARRVRVVNPYIHNLNALIDAESGQLIWVWSGERLVESAVPRPDVARLETPVGEHGGESWDGLPSEPPKVSFLEAVARTRASRTAEQLDAVYLLASYCNGNETLTRHPTWMIAAHTRLGPVGHNQPPEQEVPDPVYGWREAIDAETGASQFGSTGADLP
jgi:hypothetical protein